MNAKLIIYCFVLFVFSVFMLQNAETVTVQFLLWDFSMPRVLLLMLTLLLGLLLGAFLPFGRMLHKKP